MNILVTIPENSVRERLVPPPMARRLDGLGDVTWNDSTDQLEPDELRTLLAGIDVCVTGWGTTTLTADVLTDADRLGLVAHVGGSVASIASDELYDRGIPVTSANDVMARYVAEGILAFTLASLRRVSWFDRELAAGAWPRDHGRTASLYGSTIGFVGLGTVGGYLLDLLHPFDVSVLVYDPYVEPDRLEAYPFADLASLEETLSRADVVSIQAAKTRETIHLVDADGLASMRDGALLINAARGSIVDEEALCDELERGRLRAHLDVFEAEPLPESSPLREFDRAVLTPHVAASPVRHRLTEAVIEEIERFQRGEPLEGAVPREVYERMTLDSLSAADKSASN